ncbi:MAG: hypothetical protein ACFFC7_21585 [Candidatus Hermodarchaeota archaeon]
MRFLNKRIKDIRNNFQKNCPVFAGAFVMTLISFLGLVIVPVIARDLLTLTLSSIEWLFISIILFVATPMLSGFLGGVITRDKSKTLIFATIISTILVWGTYQILFVIDIISQAQAGLVGLG